MIDEYVESLWIVAESYRNEGGVECKTLRGLRKSWRNFPKC
jgi:hypothetical protein